MPEVELSIRCACGRVATVKVPLEPYEHVAWMGVAFHTYAEAVAAIGWKVRVGRYTVTCPECLRGIIAKA